MVVSDLYAAGCPDGRRLTQYPGWPTTEEAHARLRQALPYLPLTHNTFVSWGVRIILRDLYGWTEPVTEANWERLDGDDPRARGRPRLAARDPPPRRYHYRGHRVGPAQGGVDDDVLRYSMEWAFFTRTQRGEYDTAVYELERCWDRTPDSPIPHGASGRPAPARTIRTLDDVQAAHGRTMSPNCPPPRSAPWQLTSRPNRTIAPITEEEMSAALVRRDIAGPAERDIYASYINEAFLTALEKLPRKIAFQFSFGAEPLPHETGSLLRQETIAQLADMIARHPGVQFICYLSSRHANQSLCTLCRELPNLASPATGGTTSSPAPSAKSSKSASICFPSTAKSASSPTPTVWNGPTPRRTSCATNSRRCWRKRWSRDNTHEKRRSRLLVTCWVRPRPNW